MATTNIGMAERITDFITEWRNGLPYVVAHTSGSTGTPKEIHLLKADIRQSARMTNRFFGIDKSSTLLLPLSPDYIAGKMMIVRSLEADCRLIGIEPSNDFTTDASADLIAIVPSQIEALLAIPNVASRFRNVIVGGAAISEDRRQALIKAGVNAYVTYGMTETCSHVALRKVSDDEGVYHALSDVTFSVDEQSCLIIDIPYMSIKRVVTNDCVKLIDDKSFLWLGRRDNVINTGGIKVIAESLERDLQPYFDCNFYIVGAPDDKWGERIELVAECDSVRLNEIMQRLSASISHKLLPKKTKAVAQLPRTGNGKIKRLTIEQLTDA